MSTTTETKPRIKRAELDMRIEFHRAKIDTLMEVRGKMIEDAKEQAKAVLSEIEAANGRPASEAD